MSPSTAHHRRADDRVSSAHRSGLARGGVAVGVATTFASAANYLSNVVLGRVLGPSEFADAALVVSGLLLLSAMALGLQLMTAQAMAAGADSAALRRARRQAGSAGSLVGLTVVLASPLVADVLNMTSWVPFAILGAGVPVYFVMAVARGASQAGHEFGRLALSIGIEAGARLVVTTACVVAGMGATGAAVALTVSFAAALAPCRPPTSVGRGRATANLLVGTRPVIGATVLLLVGQVVISNGDLWVVAARVPEEAGVYAAVALIGRLVFIAAWSVITVVFPSLVSEGLGGPQASLLNRAVVLTAGLGGLMTVGAAVFAEPLMSSMVGEGFTDGAHLLWPYALATTLFVVANLFAVADVAIGRTAVPAAVAVGAIAQTIVLFVGASAGAAWVVWAQVVLMSVLLLAVFAVGLCRAAWTGRSRATADMAPVGAFRPA